MPLNPYGDTIHQTQYYKLDQLYIKYAIRELRFNVIVINEIINDVSQA